MRIRRIRIERYRGIQDLELLPRERTVLLGPNNAGKSTVLEALDLLLHSGLGRARPSPTEIDYFNRDPTAGFTVEAVLGDLPTPFRAETRDHLEGWNGEAQLLQPEPDGDGVEPVVRVRVRGTSDFDLIHEFSKEESGGARFSPRLRTQIAWVFDGRFREPHRQLNFFQGGLLERLFADADLDPAVAKLIEALGQGAEDVNSDAAVSVVLEALAGDLQQVGLLAPEQLPSFEVGSVSRRELLQSLRLALPSNDTRIPVSRHGRGAQRLLLAAILLRLATGSNQAVIGGFEEPEEALEPLRQQQLAHMLCGLAADGGQVFVVTHSPEIARAFLLDDLVLLDPDPGKPPRVLSKDLTLPVRQKYERWLDRAVVRALFARAALLVEGPGDRAVAEAFWRALAKPGAEEGAGPLVPPEQLGIDIVNCEGSPEMPMMARLLNEAGKRVAAWVEMDRPDDLAKLRDGRHCSLLVLHDATVGRQNLEQALAWSTSLPALVKALDDLATSRGYSWDEQREHLVSSSQGVAQSKRDVMKESGSITDLFDALEEAEARALIAQVLATKTVSPFEMKGARQGRVVAEAIIANDGVPEPFVRLLRGVAKWAEDGFPTDVEIHMAS